MTDSGSPIRCVIKGVATARHVSSDMDKPKSAASISCSVGADEQPDMTTADTIIDSQSFMTSHSYNRLHP